MFPPSRQAAHWATLTRGFEAPVERIRIVPMQLPRLLSEILRATSTGQGDVEVLQPVKDHHELAQLLCEGLVDVIITAGHTTGLPAALSSLLEERPGLRILVVGDYGRAACLHELRPSSVLLTGESPTELLEHLRRHVRAPHDWGCGRSGIATPGHTGRPPHD
jgi:hypothetical protein